MQVILDSSFARLGSVPIWGGKKGEFRDWTRGQRQVKMKLCLTFEFPSCNASVPFQINKGKKGSHRRSRSQSPRAFWSAPKGTWAGTLIA